MNKHNFFLRFWAFSISINCWRVEIRAKIVQCMGSIRWFKWKVLLTMLHFRMILFYDRHIFNFCIKIHIDLALTSHPDFFQHIGRRGTAVWPNCLKNCAHHTPHDFLQNVKFWLYIYIYIYIFVLLLFVHLICLKMFERLNICIFECFFKMA